MKLVHPELSRAIIDDTVDYTEWIIEAAESFATFVYELKNQCDGIDGRYVLSDADKELGISKNMDIVFDIFSIDINSKKIINKLYEEMQKVAYSEKVNVKTQEIAQSIQRYILPNHEATLHFMCETYI